MWNHGRILLAPCECSRYLGPDAVRGGVILPHLSLPLHSFPLPLQRRGVAISVDTRDPALRTLMGSGCVYLTTVRFTFVADRPNGPFSSFDIPLEGISSETFKQPVFGANRLEMEVAPVPGRGLVQPAHVSLTFNDGGTNTLLRVFFGVMERWRQPVEVRAAFFAAPQSFIQEQVAYVDSSDPTVLYLTQPTMAEGQPLVAQQQAYPPLPQQQGYVQAQPQQVQPQQMAGSTTAKTFCAIC